MKRCARKVRLAVVSLLAGWSLAAPAQIFWQAPDFRATPILPGEVGVGVALVGATPEEERAALAWQLRSALNVMALQCQFDRTLLTENTYNAVLTNHKAELDASYARITGFFKRTTKSVKAAQDALDRYGTKTYLGFSTVRGQLGFCQTAANIAHTAIFLPRGGFTAFAIDRLRELRNSLAPAGEQQFRFAMPQINIPLPIFENRCWDRRGRYKTSCGAQS